MQDHKNLISVYEASRVVLKAIRSFGVENVDFRDSIGRILAENILSDRPLPPYNRVTMDGIAVNYQSYLEGNRLFVKEGLGAAGSPQQLLKDPNNCIEIMTGASLPEGTDTVVRYEDLKEVDNGFQVNIELIQGKNVHQKGSDIKEGKVLLEKGTKIKAIDINILASVGKKNVLVNRLPKIAVVSSGDELVDVDEIPLDYQIRKSNVYMLEARLKELGLSASLFHFKDDSTSIYKQIENILEEYDVLLMSGGVSKGKFDFIPEVLEQLGIKKIFHKVAQRPGKPLWFGGLRDKTVFAFPGNPVSTLACFHRYFIPWLERCLGLPSSTKQVVLANFVTFKPNLTYLAQASIYQKDGKLVAEVAHGNGSGDLLSPSRMDGFVELPSGQDVYLQGDVYSFYPFH